ncbi:MAG TPA: CYTH domain-containing protein [Candidatus Limnocylindria bacterium]
MAIEVEARFRAENSEVFGRLAAMDRLGEAELGPAVTVDETDAYLDTADRALGAERWACRLRHRQGRHTLSLKGPPAAGTGGWLHRRPELEGPATGERVPDRWPPSEARDLLDRLRAGRPLVEVLSLRQRRAEREVILHGRRIGVLTLDDVIVVAGGGEMGGFGIVELELAAGPAGDEAALPALAAELAADPGLAAEPRSKLERALELAGARR